MATPRKTFRKTKPARGRTFNKDQRLGLATALDNIATAFIIGVVVGFGIDSKLSALGGAFILASAVALFGLSLALRGMKD